MYLHVRHLGTSLITSLYPVLSKNIAHAWSIVDQILSGENQAWGGAYAYCIPKPYLNVFLVFPKRISFFSDLPGRTGWIIRFRKSPGKVILEVCLKIYWKLFKIASQTVFLAFPKRISVPMIIFLPYLPKYDKEQQFWPKPFRKYKICGVYLAYFLTSVCQECAAWQL